MIAKFLGFLCLLCTSLFSREGIAQAEGYRTNSEFQWQAAIESLEKFHLEASDQVLDVGCGDGKVTALLSERLIGRVIGMDISEAMIAEANVRFNRDNLSFLVGSATSIPFKAQFDKVVSFNALHWVLEQEKALRSIFESLKMEGSVLLLVPGRCPNNIGVLGEKLARSEKWAPYFLDFMQVRVYYTPEEYTVLMRDVGFREISLTVIEGVANYQNREAFIRWLTPLINFIDHLPDALQKQFIEELTDEMLLIDSPASDGLVSVRLNQMRVVATKAK